MAVILLLIENQRKKVFSLLLTVFIIFGGYTPQTEGLYAKKHSARSETENSVRVKTILTHAGSKERQKKFLKKYQSIPDNKKSFKDYKKLGIIHHNLAALDLEEHTAKSVKSLEKALEKSSDSAPLCRSYLGSAKTLQGYYALNPINKISYVNEGASLIDSAVKMDSNNIRIRILRIKNSTELPFFFGRYSYVKKDLEFLQNFHEKSPGSFTDRQLAHIYHLRAEYLDSDHQRSRACEFWEKSLEMKPSPSIKRKAKSKYKNYCNGEDWTNEKK